MSDRAPSKSTLLLCAASATAAGLTLWLVWPRRPKASREALLVSLRRLREECAAVYADVGASVESSGVRKHLSSSSFSSLRRAKDAAGDAVSEEEDDKLKQVLEQPLILEAALRGASARAASELFPGATAEDLEAELLRAGEEDAEVRRSTQDIAEMHAACLRGDRAAASEVGAARAAWPVEEALQMLRELGQAKAAHLEALRLTLSEEHRIGDVPDLGTKAIHACTKAEEEVWQRKCGSDGDLASRQCLFGLALQSYSEDPPFRKRRIAIECELESAAAGAISGLVKRSSAA